MSPTLVVRHKVNDYNPWRGVYDSLSRCDSARLQRPGAAAPRTPTTC